MHNRNSKKRYKKKERREHGVKRWSCVCDLSNNDVQKLDNGEEEKERFELQNTR